MSVGFSICLFRGGGLRRVTSSPRWGVDLLSFYVPVETLNSIRFFLLQGGGFAPTTSGSLDGRSSAALDSVMFGGRGGRSSAYTDGRTVLSGEVGAGGSHFDIEMEANRLAYVRHIQVCTLPKASAETQPSTDYGTFHPCIR